MNAFLQFFDTSKYPARWFCGAGWAEHPAVGWLHIFSDLAIFSAYFAIPCILVYFARRRSDLPFRMIFLLFGGFILFCGTTHLIEAIIFWWPVYPFSGLVKLCTALISWATVIALIRIVPQALSMRSPQELEREVRARENAENALIAVNHELESRVQARTADLLRANELLHQEREHKDRFLATLAHELRNPLAPLRTGLKILHLAPEKDKATSHTEEIMDRQLATLVRLVDDLLDVSRISRGKMLLQKAPVDLANILRNAIDASRPGLDERHHTLEFTPPTSPLLLNADSVRLAQVFQNILNNAAKYSDENGRIQVRAFQKDTHAIVCIKDSGCGIAREDLPRIFDMFTQLSTSLEKVHGGLGIGLSLAKSLVEMHEGTITVHSEGLGTGCEFTLSLPLATDIPQPVPATPAVMAAPTAPSNELRILVVDDNVDAADSLATLLEISGYRCRMVHDAKTALEAFVDFRPQLVLSDIGLPEVNGYELARRIRSLDGGKEVRLVAVSGWGRSDDIKRAEEAGFDQHLTKPVDPEILLQNIADWNATR